MVGLALQATTCPTFHLPSSSNSALQEKYNIKDTTHAGPESPTSDTKLYGLPTHKSYRVIGDQDPEIKRIVSYRGRLSVKVDPSSSMLRL